MHVSINQISILINKFITKWHDKQCHYYIEHDATKLSQQERIYKPRLLLIIELIAYQLN
jgi:hypothetical protein